MRLSLTQLTDGLMPDLTDQADRLRERSDRFRHQINAEMFSTGTRWHTDDLISRLLREARVGATVSVCMPRQCGRSTSLSLSES